MKPVRVIGGGFSGLTLAFYLQKSGVPVELFERNNDLGGLIRTEKRQRGLVETAANGFLNCRMFQVLCDELGVNLVSTLPQNKKRYVLRGGRMRRWPLGPLESTRLLGGWAWYGLFGRLRPTENETLQTWAAKRFGQACFDYLAAPVASGIFGDSDLAVQLAQKAVGTPLYEKESDKTAVTHRGLVSPESGMGELITALSAHFLKRGGKIHRNAVGVIEPDYATVVATDAASASVLCASVDENLARSLLQVQYIGLTTATLFYDNDESKKGFGCLFPQREGFNSLGVLFNSDIFPNRASIRSETWILPFQNHSGGNQKNNEATLHKISKDRLRLPLRQQHPVDAVITHWPRAIPKYDLRLQEVLQGIREPNRVYLHGNYLGDLGLAKLLARSYRLAERIADEYTGF